MAEAKVPRKRKREGGERVQRAARRVDRRRFAIDYAIRFLMAAVAEERIALAQRPDGKVGRHHTESIIADAIATVPAVVAIRMRGVEAQDLGVPLSKSVRVGVDALLRAIPKEYEQAATEREFVRLHDSLKGLWHLPGGIRPKRWEHLPRSEQRELGQTPGLATLEALGENAEARAENSPKPHPEERLAFGSETRVRNEIARRMGISKNTTIALAKRTGRTNKRRSKGTGNAGTTEPNERVISLLQKTPRVLD